MKTNTFNISALRVVTAALSLSTVLAISTGANAETVKYSKASTTDATLLKTLPGFSDAKAEVNGTTIHYVVGGQGKPLVLLPGWPQTWWTYHKVMPELAKSYKVIVVDLRGMGSSSKPAGGYDKKTMAKDIYDLLQKLGYDKAYIAGHDIGAQVAWSFAANYPQATEKLIMMDVPHLDQSLYSWPLLPALNTFGPKIDENNAFAWWFAFHQVKGLPEKILAGRIQLEQEWFFTYLMKDESVLTPLDRSVYRNAYNSADAIRAGNAWYQAFPQDIADEKAYQKLTMPVLGLAGPGYNWLNYSLSAKATNSSTIHMDSGHFVQEEAPVETTKLMLDFLK